MGHQFATFELDGCLYGVDVARVQEALRLDTHTPVPHAPSSVAGLVNLRGQVVLAIDLRERLARQSRSDDAHPMMMVITVGDEPVSLFVDRVGDVIDVDPDRLGPPPPTIESTLRDFVTGVYALDDTLLLALDVDRVAQVS